MATIKIGRNNYEIKAGDYLLNNQACIQFVTGDRRPLRRRGFDIDRSLRVATGRYLKLYKPILESFDVKEIQKGRRKYTKYYFTEKTISLLEKTNEDEFLH